MSGGGGNWGEFGWWCVVWWGWWPDALQATGSACRLARKKAIRQVLERISKSMKKMAARAAESADSDDDDDLDYDRVDEL